MTKAIDYKKSFNPNHDTHKRSVYQIDQLINDTINQFISHHDVFSLSHLILQNEGIDFIRISQNKNKRTSFCSFFQSKISYSEDHIQKPYIAIHEIAHWFDNLFSVINLPAHHIGFLSAYKYLINKHIVKNKTSKAFNLIINTYNELTKGNKVPYAEDYYDVYDISKNDFDLLLSQYEKELTQVNHNNNENAVRLGLGKQRHYTKYIFDNGDHYINLIHIHNSNKCFKVIVKKFGFELNNCEAENHSVLVSPNYMFGLLHNDTLTRTRSHYWSHYKGFLLFLKNKNINIDDMYELIKNIDIFKNMSDYDYKIQLWRNNVIYIVFCHHTYKKEEILEFKKIIKQEVSKKTNIKLYQTTSQNNFEALSKSSALYG